MIEFFPVSSPILEVNWFGLERFGLIFGLVGRKVWKDWYRRVKG